MVSLVVTKKYRPTHDSGIKSELDYFRQPSADTVDPAKTMSTAETGANPDPKPPVNSPQNAGTDSVDPANMTSTPEKVANGVSETVAESSKDKSATTENVKANVIKAPEPLHRSNFPPNFVFGSGTSAYQVEGAYNEGGREMSIWDVFCRTPGKIIGESNGDVGNDQYHKYKGDIDGMEEMNLDAYRFSISWPRIIKSAGMTPTPVVNEEGIAYYNRLIDGLLEKGIEPYVTLYHWDLPQSLHNKYRGWIDKKIVKDFEEYAEVCFRAFGDRVKHWMTINEPQQFAIAGYGTGNHAPGRCSDREKSGEGNSETEPYLVAHNLLLAHAAAVDVYKRKFKLAQGGTVGIVLDCEWGEAYTDSEADKEAAERNVQFQLAWFLDPIYFGDYPAVMHNTLRGQKVELPEFTNDERVLLKGSLDFVGVNQYSSRYIAHGFDIGSEYPKKHRLVQAKVESRRGDPIGKRAGSPWLYIVPRGIAAVLMWITKRYDRPQLLVCENGMDDFDDSDNPKDLWTMCNDNKRVKFYKQYLESVLKATQSGADVRGYFAWSLMDNLEWESGYTMRFGMIYVDFNDPKRSRYMKKSFYWYSQFLLDPRMKYLKEVSVKLKLAEKKTENLWKKRWSEAEHEGVPAEEHEEVIKALEEIQGFLHDRCFNLRALEKSQ